MYYNFLNLLIKHLSALVVYANSPSFCNKNGFVTGLNNHENQTESAVWVIWLIKKKKKHNLTLRSNYYYFLFE